MKKLALQFPVAALFLFICGCGDSPQSVLDDHIEYIEDLNEVLAGIQSEEDAKKAKPELEALAARADELINRAKKLKEKAAISNEDGKRLGKAQGEYYKETKRLRAIPGVMTIIQEISGPERKLSPFFIGG